MPRRFERQGDRVGQTRIRNINRPAETLRVLQPALFFQDVAVRQRQGEAFGSCLEEPRIDPRRWLVSLVTSVAFPQRPCKQQCIQLSDIL